MVPEDGQTTPPGLTGDQAGVIVAGSATQKQPGAAAAGSAEPPAAPSQPRGFLGEFWDAVSVRTVGLIIGILLLQIGFILSYVGASTRPRRTASRSPSSHQPRSPANW